MIRPVSERRWLILATCCMSLFIVGLDNTILNIALPAIRRDLHAPLSGLQWTSDAYTLVLASLLLMAGSTADRIGRRRVFRTGLVVFATASLLCGLAPGLGWLVAFRVLQAIGGAMLNPVAMSIIANTFTEPRERARAIGVWAAVAGISIALGPLVGGALVQAVGWRAIFWVNVPVAVVALVFTARFAPESRALRPRRVDPVGQVLVLVLLAALTSAIIEGPASGWGSTKILALLAAAAIALVGLLGYEPRRTDPLIDVRLFGSAPLAGATMIAVCAFAALAGFLFVNTLYLQEVRGLSALLAGLYTLPMATMAIILAPLAGRLVGTRGPRLPLIIAGIAMTASGLQLTRLSAHTPVLALLAAYVVFGIGFGMVNTPITNTAVAGLPRAQAGVAAALASTSRQVGQSLGVAVIGSVVTAGIQGSLREHLAPASHIGWWVVTGCGAAILVLGILTTGRWAVGTAARTADRLYPDDAKVPVPTP